MNPIKTVFASLLSFAALAACSGATETPPQEPGNDTAKETVRESLSFTAPCTGTTCGEVPSSSTASKPACVPTGNTCGWSDSGGNDGTVSYRQCAKTECGTTEPGADTCPSGTTFKGNTCGSENNAACKWTTACVPPRSTTPCPDPNACGEISLVGVICSDGSNGTQNCMKVGTNKCVWQPSCD